MTTIKLPFNCRKTLLNDKVTTVHLFLTKAEFEKMFADYPFSKICKIKFPRTDKDALARVRLYSVSFEPGKKKEKCVNVNLGLKRAFAWEL